jgi:uncharacterized RDD family membrane protein YckC
VQFACPSCHQVIEHQGPRPRFCQHCGEPLSGTNTDLADAATIVGPSADASSAVLPDVTQQLGEYRLIRELGRGGMGVVYEAEHAHTGRRLALKVLSPNLPRNSVTVERFLREGRLAAAVSHPCSTFVYGAGETGGQLHIAMELVPGRTLARVVQEDGPLPVNKAVDYILDVIDGLIAAHEVGVIHRDVKPSNCFLGEDGRVKVGDFGLSKSLVTDASLTRTGEFMGTPQYAAPEQVRGGEVDARTDIYSVGATLFYLLSGRGPFVGDVASVIAQIASDAPPSLHGLRAEVPRELDRLVARSLAKDPASRFDDLAQFRQALLPFATAGVSIADVGRRLAAFFLDFMLFSLVGGCLGTLIVLILLFTRQFDLARFAGGGSATFQASMSLGTIALLIAYFGVAEGRWGCGIGKWLMDLRVVNRLGEAPGIAPALLRAALIPGVSYLPSVMPPLMFPHQNVAWHTPGGGIFFQWASIAVTWVVMLTLLSSMRSRNGYRGLHELLSGTRVVRPQRKIEKGRRTVPMIAPVMAPVPPASFGGYQVRGNLGHSAGAVVLQGVDVALERPVWLRVGDGCDAGWRARRISVTRRTRPVWLQTGESDGRRWDAYEAVPGAPLAVAVSEADGKAVSWDQGRGILLELAAELAAAVDDGTLPPVLEIEQVWIEPGGRIKLLDAPLDLEHREPPTHPMPDMADAARAVQLLRQTADLYVRGVQLPVHAQVFGDELQGRPADAATLHWAVERLRDLSQRRSTLRWDDRLGVIAASLGTEQSVYLLFALSVTTAIVLLGMQLSITNAALSLSLAGAFPFLVGFWFRGGPVFRVTGVEVRRRNQPATRLRCALRNSAAWGPSMLSFCALGWLQLLTNDPELSRSGWALGLSMSWSLPMLLHAGGAIIAIASPRRGLQDLFAGTSLAAR